MKPPTANMTTFTDQEPATKHGQNSSRTGHSRSYDGLTTSEQTENKRIPVPEHVEPEQPKRGWLSRFFLPNG
jgi:hypothetical protein